jgi:hypothetical protein
LIFSLDDHRFDRFFHDGRDDTAVFSLSGIDDDLHGGLLISINLLAKIV